MFVGVVVSGAAGFGFAPSRAFVSRSVTMQRSVALPVMELKQLQEEVPPLPQQQDTPLPRSTVGDVALAGAHLPGLSCEGVVRQTRIRIINRIERN